MFWNILKKDVKRKKTMNVILLLFIILASTFIASSVNNLLVITSAVDEYLEKAGIQDYIICTMTENEREDANEVAIAKFLDTDNKVSSWVKDTNLSIGEDQITIPSGKGFKNTLVVSSNKINQQKYFDSNNKELETIQSGEVYLSSKSMEDTKLEVGDRFTIHAGEYSKEFTIAGVCKDAMLGSHMMGMDRIVIGEKDFEELLHTNEFFYQNMYSVDTTNKKDFEQALNVEGFKVVIAFGKDIIAMAYIMDMVIAAMILVVSVCLILISLVILRFTIVFTLNEEFREIGIMKAIGIKVGKIRGIYMVKYLVISMIGAVIGFGCSIPFGTMLLKQVSKNVIMETGELGLLVNLICSILIVVIVMLSCYFCTRQVKKISPIDAIRNGSNGERFKRKGILRLATSKLPTVWFMALNDIFSGLRRYGVLILIFTIGIILVIIPVNTANTLGSKSLVPLFGGTQSDLYLISDSKGKEFFVKDGQEKVGQYITKVAEELKEKGVNATVFSEFIFHFRITKGDLVTNSMSLQGVGTTTDQYTYLGGTPPQYANEVAITHLIADKIDANIGDTVNIKVDEEEKIYVVTGIYQSMNNLGEGIRFSEKETLDYSKSTTYLGFQVKYEETPTAEEQKEYEEIVKEVFPGYTMKDSLEYIEWMIGDVVGQIDSVKQLIVMVILIINMLVAILMVKTFITKEKGEIAMMKSIGFRNSSIVWWQTLRIGTILVLSTILGVVLSPVITSVTAGKVFQMMGVETIEFVVKPLEVYVVYPMIILLVTMFASMLTALQIRNISAQETNNIE